VNILWLDREASDRAAGRLKRRVRPRLFRRTVTIPGVSRTPYAHLEPTPLKTGHADPRRPIEVRDRPAGGQGVAAVLSAFIGLWFRMTWLKISGHYTHERGGKALREVFERLGGFWMKVGQLMSLRRDVIPPEICDQLTHLQHRAIGFPPEQALATITAELGQPLDRIFSAFDPMPFAAASISQVHKARLREQDIDVVVKVQRPGIAEKFERDLKVLTFIVNQLSRLTRLRRLNLRGALGEFRQILLEETDYRYEVANMRDLRRTTRGHGVVIPRVFERLSGAKVIVMEWLPGVLMSEFIELRAADPERAGEWLRRNDINPRRVGSRLLVSFMRQLFENNLFHADLHPGNIILMRDSKVGLIDLGSVGSLDREFLILYRGIQRALADSDFAKATDLQLRLCSHLPSRNLDVLRRELNQCLKTWSAKARVKQLPFRERSVNTGSSEVSQILSRYGAQQSWEFLKIARTLSTLDGSLEHLHPGLDYIRILQRYFNEASSRAARKATSLRSLVNGFASMLATVDEYHLMLAPVFRKDTFNFEATVSKVSRIFAVFVRVLLGFGVVALLGLGYSYVRAHHARRLLMLSGTISENLDKVVPHVDSTLLYVAFFAVLVVLIVMRRILFELMRPDGEKRE
jgi:ubiquinone biosynthesis protein